MLYFTLNFDRRFRALLPVLGSLGYVSDDQLPRGNWLRPVHQREFPASYHCIPQVGLFVNGLAGTVERCPSLISIILTLSFPLHRQEGVKLSNRGPSLFYVVVMFFVTSSSSVALQKIS